MPSSGGYRLYPYYAGFSESFVRTILQSSHLAQGAVVYDPWNGSGTTTAAASKLGYSCIGFDLNPVMVIVAKARNFSPVEAGSLVPLCRAALDLSAKLALSLGADDPLLTWFKPRTASALRGIERGCAKLLIEQTDDWGLEDNGVPCMD
jgi:SAM-dependent methyltransferase